MRYLKGFTKDILAFHQGFDCLESFWLHHWKNSALVVSVINGCGDMRVTAQFFCRLVIWAYQRLNARH